MPNSRLENGLRMNLAAEFWNQRSCLPNRVEIRKTRMVILGQDIVRHELKFTLNMVYERNTESIQLNYWQENDFSGFRWGAAHPLESQQAPFSLMDNPANGT